MIEAVKNFIESHPWVLIAFVTHGVVLGTVAYLILLERKTASWVQDRIGPNRVGFDFGLPFLKFLRGMFGLGQPLADGLKFILKEDYRPKNVDKVLFTIAPGIMILVIIVSIAVIPWGGVHQVTRTVDVSNAKDPVAAAVDIVPVNGYLVGSPTIQTVINETVPGMESSQQTLATVTYRYPFQIANLNIGVLFIVGFLSLAVYGVVIGGWASNNKYSFLGGLRATANMISYEIPMGLAILAVVVLFGTLDLGQIVEKQAWMMGGFLPAWNVFTQPLTFVIFLVCIHAEANRAPFDMAEAEQELVGGYHTEYSSMRFALFFLAEYAGMITTSAVCVALFFGGWHLPFVTDGPDPLHPSIADSLWLCLLRALVFFVKTLVIIFVFMWVRWSLPRFRFDQLMMLAWRALIPMSLALLVTSAWVVYVFRGHERTEMRLDGKMGILLLVVNVAVLAVSMIVSVLIPPAPETNRKMKIAGSRFAHTPLPAGTN